MKYIKQLIKEIRAMTFSDWFFSPFSAWCIVSPIIILIVLYAASKA